MRVLFVTARFPGRHLRGDQARAFEQIRHLSARHAITVLCAAAPEPGLVDGERLYDWCEAVHVVPGSTASACAAAVLGLFNGRPLQTALFDRWPSAIALEHVLVGGRFDLAHVQMARLGGLLPRLAAAMPCVLDLVDALSANMRRRAAFDRGPLRLLAAFEADRLLHLERALLAQASGVAISSPVDRCAIDPAAPMHLVANGVDLERFPFDDRPRSQRIVFAGNLGYFPNVDAAQWFAREVLPRVRVAVPAAELLLLGARPAPALRRLAALAPGVTLVGPVADMHRWLVGAGVAISPLRAGSGQQLKLLEAMASGVPTVATTRSADALDVEHGSHLLVADEPQAMADAVVRLLTDRALAQRIAVAARQRVATRYRWSDAADALERLWRQVAEDGHGVRSAPCIHQRL